MPLGGGVILGGLALGRAIYGGIQKHKANQLAKSNVRPDYTIPQEYLDNAALAKQMAQVGLPQQQYNNAMNGINRNLSVGIGAAGRSSNPTGSIASIVRGTNDAQLNLDAQDANARMNNQRFAIGQNAVLGQQMLAKQQWDKFGKFQENAAASRALSAAGDQNINNAANTIAGAGLQYLGNMNAGTADTNPRYAGGNFFQRMSGGLKTPNADLSPASAAGFAMPSGSIGNRLAGPSYNYGTQWFNPIAG
jgi:hypothetical protein